MAKLSFDNVKDTGSYAPITPGKYICRVYDTNYVLSSSQNPMITTVLEVTGEQFGGRRVFDNFVLNNNVGLQRLKQIVYAIGLTEIDIPDNYGNKDNPMQIVEMHGRECEVEIILDPKDNSRNRIKSYKKGGDTTSGVPF